MALRVTFVAAARSTPALAERFQDDRPLDQAGWEEVQRAAGGLIPLAAAELRYCSPTPRSRATGDALGYAPLVQLALRDCDMGRWQGLTLGEARAPPRTAASRCSRSSHGSAAGSTPGRWRTAAGSSPSRNPR
jgi:broad specificity phosphatase PhoE